jgi:two-component system KDP operon response regulator KdpE
MSSEPRQTSGVRELVGAEVLVLDRDPRVQRGVTELLADSSLHVTCASEPEAALALFERQFFSVAIVDLDTPNVGDGLQAIAAIKQRSPTTMVIGLTPRKSFDDAVAAARAGAVDVVLKSPESVAYLHERVLEAAGRSVGKREVNSILAEVRDSHEDFIKRFMEAERRAHDLAERLAGHDPGRDDLAEALHVLVVDPDPALFKAALAGAPPGFVVESVVAGGEALDRLGSGHFHLVLVAEQLPDLPGTMVVRSLKSQMPELITLLYTPPGPFGRVDMVETTVTAPVLREYVKPAQLVDKLPELADALRAKTRERRYTQVFRERHYDFLRRYVEMKIKIDRALGGGR